MMPLRKRDKESFHQEVAFKTTTYRASRPANPAFSCTYVFCLSTFHPISVKETSVLIRKNSMEKYREISPTR